MHSTSHIARSIFLVSSAVLLLGYIFTQDNLLTRNLLARAPTALTRHISVPSLTVSTYQKGFASGVSKMNGTSTHKTPIYFWSHGAPSLIEDTGHPAYGKIQALGKEITTKVKPKAVVVISGHWESDERDTVQVNTAEITDLIYDFYGFPPHYYEWKYPHVGSKELAENVMQRLQAAGFKTEGVRRGLDHGVWASFSCAFNPETNPLNVPIVQVSLLQSESGIEHYKLGAALASLRDENVAIICSGQAVHNLRDYFGPGGFSNQPKEYAVTFDEALKEAVESEPGVREEKMEELLKRRDARRAHPSFDHLLPIHVAAGAAGEDKGERVWTMLERSMSWGQYRFGEVSA